MKVLVMNGTKEEWFYSISDAMDWCAAHGHMVRPSQFDPYTFFVI